ncbi:MAG: hypothetical protein M3400_05150, partial [Actinomycetota bacterium]|nr:hypothetical protein [Actinomycetota bacterium]
SWSRRVNAPKLSALRVRRMDLAVLIELLATVDRPAQWWGNLYAALERTDSIEDRDALSAIPVPLAGGRMAYGARGLLIPAPDLQTAELGALDLRLVHPGAVADANSRRLLERLGATPATATGVLTSPAVREAVAASLDEEDPEPIAKAVLALVRASGSTVDAYPWLADLALCDTDGEWTPAGELVLPGSPLANVLDRDALGLADADLVATFGAAALVAVGVLETFAVVRAEGHEVGEVQHDVDAESDWYDAVFDRLPQDARAPIISQFVAVRDLDVVRPDRWRQALRLLADLPADVFADAMVAITANAPVAVPSYTRWWLSTHPVLNGQRPDRLRHPDADDLVGLFELADAPPATLALIRCLSSVEDALADPGTAIELLERLGAPERSVRVDVVADVYPRLAVALDGIDVEPPQRVRVAPDQTVDRGAAVVVDAPYLLPLLARAPVPAPRLATAVADLLDVPLASEIVTASVTSVAASITECADIPGASIAARRLGIAALSGQLALHDPLLVDGDRPVPWWPEGDLDHVDSGSGPAALGRALAWRHDRWPLRAAIAEAIAQPDAAARLIAEDGTG